MPLQQGKCQERPKRAFRAVGSLDDNRGHFCYRGAYLDSAQSVLVETTGIEPATPGLQSLCSPN